MRQRAGSIQNAEIRGNSFGHLLPGIAVDRAIPVEAALESMENVDDRSDDAQKDNKPVELGATMPPSPWSNSLHLRVMWLAQ